MTQQEMAVFWDMGGYGPYIWPCYGLAVLMMLGLLCHALHEWRKTRKLQHHLQSVLSGEESRT